MWQMTHPARTALASVTLACTLLLSAGCAGQAAAPANPDIDWAQAPVVRVSYAVGFFHPGVINLRLGQPIRLVFWNDAGRPHDFVTNLFTSVTQRAGQKRGGVRVILQAIDQVEYDIVPQTAGSYTLTTIMYEVPGSVPAARIVVK